MSVKYGVQFDSEPLCRVMTSLVARSRDIDMSVVAEALQTAVDDVIQSEGAVGSQGQWDPMSAETVRRHPERVGGALLQATGRLANLNARTGSFFAEVSSPADYAVYHVTGTRSMPRRDPFALEFSRVLEEIGEEIMADIVT